MPKYQGIAFEFYTGKSKTKTVRAKKKSEAVRILKKHFKQFKDYEFYDAKRVTKKRRK